MAAATAEVVILVVAGEVTLAAVAAVISAAVECTWVAALLISEGAACIWAAPVLVARRQLTLVVAPCIPGTWEDAPFRALRCTETWVGFALESAVA